MPTLERTGWIATIVLFFLYVVAELGTNSPLASFKTLIFLGSVVFVVSTVGYSFVERYVIEPRILLQPFNEENIGLTEFRFVIQGRNKRFPHLQVQASYGWGAHLTFLQRLKRVIHPPPETTTHTAWLPLDMRDFSLGELVRGKEGQRVSEIALEQHDLKKFTFVTFYAQEKRIRFAVIEEPVHDAVFSNAILVTPNPEIVAKFIGLPRAIVKRYVAVYNPPPWAPDHPALDLIDARKRKAKQLIFKREKMLGRIGKDKIVTAFQKLPDGVIAQVSSEEALREISKYVKRTP